MSKRKSFAKLKEIYPMPNLLDLQLLSYKEFLQADVRSEERKSLGLQEAFQEVFPIESFDKRFRLEFVSYTLGKPKYSVEECRRRGMTFASPLRANLRLITPNDVKIQEVYFGELPLMTPTAPLIITATNARHCQSAAAFAGVCFERNSIRPVKRSFTAAINPYRGAWLEFKYDLNEVILAYVDRRRSFPATQILRIMGFSGDEEITSAFGDVPEIANTLRRISRRIRRSFDRFLPQDAPDRACDPRKRGRGVVLSSLF
jgi:DNA-directed RNA polymerase subunit beta